MKACYKTCANPPVTPQSKEQAEIILIQTELTGDGCTTWSLQAIKVFCLPFPCVLVSQEANGGWFTFSFLQVISDC